MIHKVNLVYPKANHFFEWMEMVKLIFFVMICSRLKLIAFTILTKVDVSGNQACFFIPLPPNFVMKCHEAVF